MGIIRRLSYVFLCLVPLLNFVVVGARGLRPYWFVGVVYFAAMIFAAWNLCGRAVRTGTEREQRMCLTGGLLILFTVVVALLWVGLAPPFQATAVENRMRYMVLALGSITATAGYLMLQAQQQPSLMRKLVLPGNAANRWPLRVPVRRDFHIHSAATRLRQR